MLGIVLDCFNVIYMRHILAIQSYATLEYQVIKRMVVIGEDGKVL